MQDVKWFAREKKTREEEIKVNLYLNGAPRFCKLQPLINPQIRAVR